MTVVTVGGESYYIQPRLFDKWNDIKRNLIKRDEDKVFIVDGRERTGKSVFAIQQAAYIDPTLIEDPELKRICFSTEEFLEAIRTTESGRCIVFDEAFRGLSSRSALSKSNRAIVQAMMEMGQKNLVVFIVLPSFFLLDIYAAKLRSNALFHIAKKKNSNVRFFKCYNYQKKAELHYLGIRKGWGYKVKTNFMGNFYNKYPGGKDFEDRYRAKKRKALETMEQALGNDNDSKITSAKDRKYQELLLKLKERGYTYDEISDELNIPKTTVYRNINKLKNHQLTQKSSNVPIPLYNTISIEKSDDGQAPK